MKKVVSLVLIGALLISLVVGCDKSTREQGAEEKKPTVASNVKDKDKKEEPIIIEWLAYNNYDKPDENADVVKALEEKYNCDFNFWYLDGEKFLELLGVRLASGEMPDTFNLPGDTSIQPYIKQRVAGEITKEMFDRIPSYMADIAKFDVDNNLFTDVKYDGKIYGLKNISLTGSYPTVLTWRKDWLANVGIDKIPETIEEFEEAIYKFTFEDPDGNGKKDTYGLSTNAMNAVFGAFGDIPLKEFRGKGRQSCFMANRDGELVYAVVQPEMKEALTLLNKWYKDGVIDPEFITGENKGGYWAVSHAFTNDRIGVTGMVMATHFNPPLTDKVEKGGACYEEFKAVHPDVVWGETIDIGAPPVGPQGKSGTHAWGARGSKFIITTNAIKDPRKLDVILSLIEDNATDESQQDLTTKGIEGIHYTKDGEHYLMNEDLFKERKPEAYGIQVLSFGVTTDYQKKGYKENYDFLDKYKSAGYADQVYPTLEEHNKYNNDLNRYALESYINMITGKQDVSEFDAFVAQFMKMGGQEITDKINVEYKKIMGK